MQQTPRDTKSFGMVKETSLILNLLNPKFYECFRKDQGCLIQTLSKINFIFLYLNLGQDSFLPWLIEFFFTIVT